MNEGRPEAALDVGWDRRLGVSPRGARHEDKGVDAESPTHRSLLFSFGHHRGWTVIERCPPRNGQSGGFLALLPPAAAGESIERPGDREGAMRDARRTVAIAVLLTLVACSNGSDGPAVGAAFAERAVAACNDAKALKDAQGPFPYPDFNPTDPEPAKFPGVADALMKTDVTFTTWLEDMRALGEPPSGNESWDALLDAIEAHVRINRDQIDAAGEGDTERFAADYDEGVATQEALLDAATDAGVPECAKVDR
jgi:hypothetical protein